MTEKLSNKYTVREPRGSFAFLAMDAAQGMLSQSDLMRKMMEHCVEPKIEDFDTLTMAEMLQLIRDVGEYMKKAQLAADPSSDGASS